MFASSRTSSREQVKWVWRLTNTLRTVLKARRKYWFFNDLFGFFKLTIVIVREREVREKDLKDNRGESTYTNAIVRLDTRVHRS